MKVLGRLVALVLLGAGSATAGAVMIDDADFLKACKEQAIKGNYSVMDSNNHRTTIKPEGVEAYCKGMLPAMKERVSLYPQEGDKYAVNQGRGGKKLVDAPALVPEIVEYVVGGLRY